MKISGIYQIQSKIKPKRIYIGSSILINKRWNSHLNELRKRNHKNKKLQNHFNKYGEADLHFFILLGCEKEDLLKTEQYFLDSYKPYFNISPTAGNTLGIKFSDELRKKMSESHKGLNIWLKGKKLSKEHCEKLSNKLIGNKRTLGMKHSIFTLKKMAESKIGEKNPFYGKHHTVSSKEKISRSKLGKNKIPKTEEHKQHLRESWILKKLNKAV